MAIGETIALLRLEHNLTQEQLAEKLYVTRQAVSRWENGETTPSIDMCKLLAVTFDVPVSCLLETPAYPQCQSCGMPLADGEHGTEADGSPSADFCQHCYQKGRFTHDASLDEMIEHCAPFMVRYAGMTLDDAVSFLATILPNLKRWRMVRENERLYGQEARERYGSDVIDAANEKLLAMDEVEYEDLNKLGADINEQLRVALASGSIESPEARKLCAMHVAWIKGYWPEGSYSSEAHRALAQGYLADERFVAYYDGAAGAGATQFLCDALCAYLR